MNRRGKSKTLNQATDQLNRITDYYERTGRGETARRIRSGSRSVGGVIGNMADRVSMRGGDPFTPQGMNMKVSFRDRTTTPTDAEYNSAVSRSKLQNRINAVTNEKFGGKAAYRAKRRAQGLSAG